MSSHSGTVAPFSPIAIIEVDAIDASIPHLTVGQLIAKLQEYPPDLVTVLWNDHDGEHFPLKKVGWITTKTGWYEGEVGERIYKQVRIEAVVIE